jgi:molybdopterin/thiamine biosynthesis adenylyltransferase/molybdopterin synthase catalytic subunit/rhodanese-related sulfurtransferase
MQKFFISKDKLDCAALSETLKNESSGAFVSFEGWVRNKNDGLPVRALEYEVFHDLALSEGQKVLKEAIEKFSLTGASCVHREGYLKLGECAIWIGVTAPHRHEALSACRYIIDEVKHRLPVWKKEHYVGLEPQWVNCQHHHHHTPPISISADDFYARQMLLKEIGTQGQTRLSNAKALIVGTGGLGSSAALALAGAGIGMIGVADHDTLSASNLHRQILYSAEDIGKPKAGLAAARIKSLNPLIDVKVYQDKVTAENVEELFSQYDIILDCTDNFTSKYLLNDAAVVFRKPLIQASLYQFEGQLLVIDPRNEAGCLRCLFPDAPEPGMVGDCATAGVLGTVPMTFGTLQANEAIKLILGLKVTTDLLTFDMLSLQSHAIARQRKVDCPACGKQSTKPDLGANLEILPLSSETESVLRQKFAFIDVRELWETQIDPIEESIHLPTSRFDISALTIEKDQPVLVICAHGVRSLEAARYLRAAGWKKAYSLRGGIESLHKTKQAA